MVLGGLAGGFYRDSDFVRRVKLAWHIFVRRNVFGLELRLGESKN